MNPKIAANDVARILKGLSLLGERVVATSGPGVKQDVARWCSHASDIVKLAWTITSTISSSSGSSSSSSSSDSSNSSNTSSYNSSSNSKNSNSIPPIPKEAYDPIKFPHMTKEFISNFETQSNDNVAKKRSSMKANRIPSSPTERLMGFGGLAFRMTLGAVKENINRSVFGSNDADISSSNASGGAAGGGGTVRLSSENAVILSEALCRMRGAALKLGQMLSLQEDSSIPKALSEALERVRQSADYMPNEQLEEQLVDELGDKWRDLFVDFDYVPIAAASIGQVHKATLLVPLEAGDEVGVGGVVTGSGGVVSSDRKNKIVPIAVKIQYPGVADSIDSDLLNLKRLMELTNILPKGLFVDQIIEVAGSELKEECDYLFEAQAQMKYRVLVENDSILSKHVYVPKVYLSASSSRVISTELIRGVPIDQAATFPQEIRDALARTMLYLTIKELFCWRFVQSDPNFSNFMFDASSNRINLIDFGAARTYPKTFIDTYLKLVWAASNQDKDTILKLSIKLGFLTGEESPEMIKAHVESGLVVGEPFLKSTKPFSFGTSNLTEKVGKHGDTFMKYRLTPPPSEAYSLHRKLAGAFLLCIRLKANIQCRDILEDCYNNYDFDSKE